MWTCRLVEYDNMKPRVGTDMKIGDMFYSPTPEEIEAADSYKEKFNGWFRLQVLHLSDFYKQNNAYRRPLFVVLPGNTLWCIDGQCWSSGQHYGGWTITGEAPFITVSPSINIGGSYHGFLQNGLISADCEGRLYDSEGHLIRST